MPLELDLLEKFCMKTYERYYELYSWAYMSPSVHKLLRHGCEVARKFEMPTMYYAEDCSESSHKFHRRNMEEHARQISRSARLLDVYNRAVYMSDPKMSLISLNKRRKFYKEHPITPEMEPSILRESRHEQSQK